MKAYKMGYTIGSIIVLILAITVVILLGLPIYLGLVATLLFMMGLSCYRGYALWEVVTMVVSKMRDVDYVAGMMLLIGGLVALWMQIGTIPSLIYFGFTYLADYNLVLTAYAVCMAMSLMIGSAIGTLSTIGVVFLAVGQGIGIPAGLMVGAIASGAYVGDRMSPLASGGNLATAAVNAKLTDVLKKLYRFNVLPIVAVAAIYTIIGLQYGVDAAAQETLLKVTTLIGQHYDIGMLVIIPLVVLLASILALKLGIIKSLTVTTGVSAAIGLFIQGTEPVDMLSNYITGYVSQTEGLSQIIHGGGLLSMYSVVLAILFSAGINGILEGTGMIRPLLDRWIGQSKSTGKLIRKTVYTCVVVTVLTCNQSLTALLTGSYFSEKFEAAGLERTDLARVILDTGILIVALIPWNVNAIFFKSITGITALEYAPYAYYLWIVPIMTMLWSFIIEKGLKQTP